MIPCEVLSKFLSILEDGNDIELNLVPKRMNGAEGRDWYTRFVWKVGRTECKWEGFDTAFECMQDVNRAYDAGEIT